MDYSCVPCDRYFGSREALGQHQKNSPVHKKTIHCETCDRYFGSKEALKEHEQASPIHKKSFYCKTCGCFLSSKNALKRHRQDFQIYQTCSENSPDASSDWQGGEAASRRYTWTSDPALNMTSLIQRFSRALVSANPGTNVTSTARVNVIKPIRETRELFMFPELHSYVADAVSTDISATWFNKDDEDELFNQEWFTHVMGRFICNKDTCKKQFWDSRKVPIEIRGYNDNGYSAIVYNQRCKSCDQLGTFELDKRSYIERVAYRLKKWAGVEMEAPPFNGIEGPPHERAYCEGCKRGKCREGDGFELY
ncbi:hypothetical protein EKO04_006315 [Ascochyta lentis]|uniref:C2H2-type domain-containing protein n=1 Tax=Ascochyta lentis TaxID=205686 RepID=A0A8H7J2P1_9PLEO|nr:hypothetical protein EKO04_006315 [Ascochyta lentis]